MPHFMVRKIKIGVRYFKNISQVGKRFFYDLDHQGHPIDRNTVINYEVSLRLSKTEFLDLIKNITGNQNPTKNVRKYNFHLDKGRKLIDTNYCTTTLHLPKDINGYPITKIGIAVDYRSNKVRGNILFIFADQNNNEVCISIHINYSKTDVQYLLKLNKKLNNAVNALDPQNNFLWQLRPWNDFNRLGYVVTSGQQEEANYKTAYNAAEAAEAVRLFDELPGL